MNSSAVHPVKPSAVNCNQAVADCCSSHFGSSISRSSFLGEPSRQLKCSSRPNLDFQKQHNGGHVCGDENKQHRLPISSVLSLKDAKKSLRSRKKVSPVFPVNLNSCFRVWLSQIFQDVVDAESNVKKISINESDIGSMKTLAAEQDTERPLGPLQGYIMQTLNGSGYSPISFIEVGDDLITPRALAEVAITDLLSAIPSINALRTLPYFDMLHSSLLQFPSITHHHLEEGSLSDLKIRQGGRVSFVSSDDLGSVDALATWLSMRLPSGVEQWGTTPGTKRVSNLWMELKEGEIVLEDAHPPRRTVHVASVKIRNKAGFMLVEAHQEMADGSIRHRNRPLSEKMRPGEDVEEACFRGIFEELGSHLGARNRVRILRGSYRQKQEERESLSYPGLLTLYVIHSVDAIIEDLPETGFYTVEDEMTGQYGMDQVVLSCQKHGPMCNGTAVGVKKHFWQWVPQAL